MKALIIGAAGFVGSYLARHLSCELGWETCLTKLPQETLAVEGCKVFDLDILKQENIAALLEQIQPDVIFHLAAQSSVAVSWKAPQMTVSVNVMGCLNLLEAVRSLKAEQKPRVLLIGSGEEYGHLPKGVSLVSEETLPTPGNPYAVSKLAQNHFGTLYARAYGLPVVMVRAFNHIGVGQSSQFVASDFCRQAAEIALGLREPVMRTGNLAAKRDFTDVRDVVRAYTMLAVQGRAGQTYNVGSGKAIAIEELLYTIINISNTNITVETDPAKLRPVDIPEITADITKLRQDTDWQAEIPLRQTLQEMFTHWKAQLEKEGKSS